MSEVTCKVVRGTTYRGKTLNEGDVVTMDPDTFRKLSMTHDVIETITEAKPQEPAQKSTTAQPTKKTA